ncbi:MAG TPA: ribonuclease [Devosia sp.]|nr:ribonuclease [Devosia sp.]
MLRRVALLAVAAALAAGLPAAAAEKGHGFYVLALSWEPAFCEASGDKPECRNEPEADARRLSLHGLWPREQYCGVAPATVEADRRGDWSALPAPDLRPQTRDDLMDAMPGAQSALDRHEWIKHGTCSGVSADRYFARAVLFEGTINASAVGELLARRSGRRLDQGELKAAFDTAFGAGAGDRVRLACVEDGGRRLISEITVGLYGDVMGAGGIGELIAAANPTDPGCGGGILDPVGPQ